MENKTAIGKKGEQLAAEFLMKKGFEIVVRNYRHGRAEIDLIVVGTTTPDLIFPR